MRRSFQPLTVLVILVSGAAAQVVPGFGGAPPGKSACVVRWTHVHRPPDVDRTFDSKWSLGEESRAGVVVSAFMLVNALGADGRGDSPVARARPRARARHANGYAFECFHASGRVLVTTRIRNHMVAQVSITGVGHHAADLFHKALSTTGHVHDETRRLRATAVAGWTLPLPIHPTASGAGNGHAADTKSVDYDESFTKELARESVRWSNEGAVDVELARAFFDDAGTVDGSTEHDVVFRTNMRCLTHGTRGDFSYWNASPGPDGVHPFSSFQLADTGRRADGSAVYVHPTPPVTWVDDR